MKSILLKSIPYIIAFAILNLIIYAFSGFYNQERRYVERIDNTIENKAEVIFLGDSHVETIKLLDLSDNIGNLAFGADGIYEMYLKVLSTEQFNDNLKYVFIATEPQIFNNTSSPNRTFLNTYLFKIDDTLNVYGKSKLDLVVDKVPMFNDNYVKYASNWVYEHFKNGKKQSENILWSELTEEQRTEIAVKTGKLDHNSVMENKDYINNFKLLVETCKVKNIKVIGVRFPVNENYIGQCSEENQIKVDSFIKSLNLYKHLDYTTSIKDVKYFHDEDHLNEEGIKILADIIYEDTNIKLTE